MQPPEERGDRHHRDARADEEPLAAVGDGLLLGLLRPVLVLAIGPHRPSVAIHRATRLFEMLFGHSLDLSAGGMPFRGWSIRPPKPSSHPRSGRHMAKQPADRFLPQVRASEEAE